jgi:hypothetical protein
VSDFEPVNSQENPAQLTSGDVTRAELTSTAPLAAEPSVTAPKPADNGQRIALAAALAVVLVAGGGLGWVAFGHTDAKPKPWSAPAPKKTGSYGALSGGIHYGQLSKLLLPQPHGYEPGPDLDQLGDNTQLTGKQATSLYESQYDDLPKSQRAALAKAVGKMGIKGLGLRSYQNETTNKVVQIQLMQINKQFAKSSTRNVTELMNAFLKKGPKVPGHSEAHCWVTSMAKHGAIQDLDCLAAEGDLMVTYTAEGPKPVSGGDVLTILKDQLDRIADPGESV